MCFGNDTEVPAPAPPPEVLETSAPAKKTVGDISIAKETAENQASANKGSATTSKASDLEKSNPLAIGTKKYRNVNALGTSGLSIKKAPSGIAL